MKKEPSKPFFKSIITIGPDPFGEFQNDRLRLEAVKSRHRRDVWRSALRVLGTTITASALVAATWIRFCAA